MTLNRMLTIMTLKKEDEEQHLQIVHITIQFVNMHCRHMIYKGMNDGNISASHGVKKRQKHYFFRNTTSPAIKVPCLTDSTKDISSLRKESSHLPYTRTCLIFSILSVLATISYLMCLYCYVLNGVIP